MRRIARDPETNRDLFVLELEAPDDLPRALDLPSRHFACLVAWDSREASVDEIARLATKLMKEGAAYFVCWGPGCERVHDIVDEIDADPDDPVGSPEASVIMTTWHADESLEDAIWFFLNETSPDEHYETTLGSSLAVSIGSSKWAAVLRAALLKPRGSDAR